MKLYLKIVLGIVIVVGAVFGYARYKNQPPPLATPDYYEY